MNDETSRRYYGVISLVACTYLAAWMCIMTDDTNDKGRKLHELMLKAGENLADELGGKPDAPYHSKSEMRRIEIMKEAEKKPILIDDKYLIRHLDRIEMASEITVPADQFKQILLLALTGWPYTKDGKRK